MRANDPHRFQGESDKVATLNPQDTATGVNLFTVAFSRFVLIIQCPTLYQYSRMMNPRGPSLVWCPRGLSRALLNFGTPGSSESLYRKKRGIMCRPCQRQIRHLESHWCRIGKNASP